MAAFAPMNFAAQASETAGDAQGSASAVLRDRRRPIIVWLRAIDHYCRVRPAPALRTVHRRRRRRRPVAAGRRVSLTGLTLAEAQKLIQDRFADGVLVQPAVSVRITEYRPIFVTGNVRKPGSYRFMIGQSVKAAIAAAGGEGEPLEQNFNGAVSDYITAEQRVRQLEADHSVLLMRKARLEAQRDGNDNFIMPLLVGLSRRDVDFELAYSTENETFSRLAEMYRSQVQAVQNQRPRIQAEIDAVSDQIVKQKEHLGIVNDHLTDLETLFNKGLLRKDVLLNEQIQKTLVEGQLSTLEAQVARLRQAMGELEIRLGDVKANYLRQTLGELQDTSQRLRDVETSIGPARRLLQVKSQSAGGRC